MYGGILSLSGKYLYFRTEFNPKGYHVINNNLIYLQKFDNINRISDLLLINKFFEKSYNIQEIYTWKFMTIEELIFRVYNSRRRKNMFFKNQITIHNFSLTFYDNFYRLEYLYKQKYYYHKEETLNKLLNNITFSKIKNKLEYYIYKYII